MARIRTVKPEFWADEKIGALTPLARLAFIGSWNHADDEGLLRWTTEYLSASVFMYDGLPAKRIQSVMDELVLADLVFPYTIGKTRQKLAYVVNFRQHQKINRPQPSKLTPPVIDKEEVRLMYANRDGWTCHLCLGPINKQRVVIFNAYDGTQNIPGSEELNLSMDHLVPRSLGGGDEPSNIKSTHVSCNKARCNRPIEEFRVPRSVQGALRGSVNGHGTRTDASPPDQVTGSREEEQGGEPAEPPPPQCRKHLNNPNPGPCGGCADARRAREAWDASAAERAARQAEAERFAVRACQLCNSEGQRWHPESKGNGTVGRCDHQLLPRQEPA